MVEQTRYGGQIKYGRPLTYKGGVNDGGDPAEKSGKPYKVERGVVLFPENNSQREDKACHSAEAVGNYSKPLRRTVSEYLGEPVCRDGREKQQGKELEKEPLRTLVYGKPSRE